MRAISSSTVITDPSRAGIALGESLASMSPEVVFLFSSVHYSVPELLEGLHDALECDDIIVVGNSGNGFYETTGASNHGVAVLGLSSDGQVRWRLEHVERLHEDLEAKVEKLMASLSEEGDTPCLGFLVSDFRVDASRIEALLREMVGFPVVGGLAADDFQMQSSYLYDNRGVISDALVVLAAYGDMRFSIHVGNSLQTIGRSGLNETRALTQAFAPGLPLAGFTSFGEIAPLRRDKGYTHNLFHNMSYVLLLIEQ